LSSIPRPADDHAGIRFFHLREKSLLRANLLSFASLGLAFLLSHFPNNIANPYLVLPLVLALLAAADAARCMQPTWGFYHGAVLLTLYSDILIITLILFFLLWPYFRWFV
jgi:hypothetical protein